LVALSCPVAAWAQVAPSPSSDGGAQALTSPATPTFVERQRVLRIERIRADRRIRRAARRWPPRTPGWTLRLGPRLYIGEIALQLGALFDASLEYRPQAPVFFAVAVDPFGLIWADGEKVGLFGIHLILGYETDSMLLAVTGGTRYSRIYHPTRRIVAATGIAGVQVRVGADEGLHVLVRAEAVFVDGRPANVDGLLEVRFPTLGPAFTGLLRGGFAGFASVELGLRYHVERPGHGPFFLTPMLGFIKVDLQLRSLFGYTGGVRVEMRLPR